MKQSKIKQAFSPNVFFPWGCINMLLIHRKLEFLKLYVEYLKSIAQLYKDGQRKSHIIYFSLWCFISRGLCVFKENLETRSSNLNTNLRKRSDVCKIFKHQSPEKRCHKLHVGFPNFNHLQQKYGKESQWKSSQLHMLQSRSLQGLILVPSLLHYLGQVT